MKNNKKKNGKMAGRIVALSFLGVTLIGSLTVLFMLLFTDVFPFQKKTINNSTIQDYILDNNGVEIKIEGITARFTREQAYAGDRVLAGQFVVEANYGDGYVMEITDYTCDELTEDCRLTLGSNNFVFKYGSYTSIVTVNATNVRDLETPPNYILYDVDEEHAEELINKIVSGESNFEDTFADVAFTGDSQIKAIATNGLLSMHRMVAEVGESITYFEQNYDEVVNVATGSEFIIVHYGINTLSASEEDNAELIARYRAVLERLKKDVPDTRIIVSGVFPVSDTIRYTKTRFMQINNYNFSLYEMCQELDIEYMSDNVYLSANQNLFSEDGIHLSRQFYSDYWLFNIIRTIGINN